jgi:tyrosinase
MLQLSVFVWALCALSTFVTAQNVPVTGVKVAKGAEVPLRKNLNSLQAAGGPQWDIYLRALADLQSQDAKNQLSFFQIAGIHGKPYMEWNNAGPRTSDGWQGYCPHGEKLFLTWHRPYVVLYEQRLVETAVKLANQYPSSVKDQYVKAAQSLRSPYWDWAATPSVPAATVPEKMTVKIPNGSGVKSVQIDNPLRRYRFPASATSGAFGSFNKDPVTVRCKSPQNFPNTANSAMSRRPYKQWVYDAFTRSNDFAQFSSTGSSGTSLEMIHNAVHWDGGCGSHFLDADYSAFDPLFMLHHTNVDRLWAYWQFMKPQHATFARNYPGDARYSTPRGTSIGPTNPLKPFYSAPGKFHTSDSVKSIKSFGYTYEGLEYWRKSDSQMQKDATALINRMYAPGSSQKRKRSNGSTTRYFAQVKVDVEQIERPCAINIYTNTTNVGSFIVMKQPATGAFNGEFTLDKVADLVEAVLENPLQVIADLAMGLRVEITKPDGTVIPIDTVPSFELKLEEVEVIPAKSEIELPKFVEPEQFIVPVNCSCGTEY